MLSSATGNQQSAPGSSIACRGRPRAERTIEQFAAVGLAAGEFQSHNVALRSVSKMKPGGRLEGLNRTWASLRSLMGMPIVDVILCVACVGTCRVNGP
jgi:hypothetical protein